MDGAFSHGHMAYTVYILQSDRDGSFYVGHTVNLGDRLRRHNEGRSPYTKTKIPWKVVYQEEYLTRSQAIEREQELKSKKNRAYIEQLVRASRGVFREGCRFKPRRSRQK
jgi:putative endonuclease